jgi:hypothetical protein
MPPSIPPEAENFSPQRAMSGPDPDDTAINKTGAQRGALIKASLHRGPINN